MSHTAEGADATEGMVELFMTLVVLVSELRMEAWYAELAVL
jgi:hypothetical protein